MKYIDLFAGIGGFRMGISKAHPDWECVYSSEWDKYANSVYRKHYGECDNRDIREVDAKDIPDHDLLCGGFPCQSFSVAGKRGGFEDTRGTLFFEIARIAKEKRPRLLLLENVKGLLSHDQGRTFGVILSTLDELGYDCQWQVLNSKDFGVPQNRERVFIIGHLRGTPRPQVFPLGGTNQQDIVQLNDSRRQPKILQHSRSSDGKEITYNQRDIAGTLKQPSGNQQNFVAIPVLTPDRAEKRQNGRRMKTNGEPSFTLTGQDIHGVMVSKTVRAGGRKSPHGCKQNWDSYEFDGVIRRLTPGECMALQGFPRD
jgi:DNA (cytosine-5)-methyltransferase 1